MSGFPEGTVIIRDVRDGLVRQLVVRRDGVRHTRYLVPSVMMYPVVRVGELELARRALEKAPLRS